MDLKGIFASPEFQSLVNTLVEQKVNAKIHESQKRKKDDDDNDKCFYPQGFVPVKKIKVIQALNAYKVNPSGMNEDFISVGKSSQFLKTDLRFDLNFYFSALYLQMITFM